VKFEELPLAGAWRIVAERHEDERGYFARTFDAAEFEARGLETTVAECSVSRNPRRLTLRGMHFQRPPHEEAKLIRCTSGAVYDVIIDVREGSGTYRKWHAETLSRENGVMLYVPAGLAHGYLTMEDDTELAYQISTPYAPASAAGYRWDDPAFAIAWPERPALISVRDASYPDHGPGAARAAR
jgi:dTDP-4-dehydrorhamnose 3,5-epimerase